EIQQILMLSLLIFFFQAEDGIRDRNVTGVQTCALPIWESWTANQHIIRVVPANSEIAGYLNVFLASDYGHQLITRFTYGSVVDEIGRASCRERVWIYVVDGSVNQKHERIRRCKRRRREE